MEIVSILLLGIQLLILLKIWQVNKQILQQLKIQIEKKQVVKKGKNDDIKEEKKEVRTTEAELEKKGIEEEKLLFEVLGEVFPFQKT